MDTAKLLLRRRTKKRDLAGSLEEKHVLHQRVETLIAYPDAVEFFRTCFLCTLAAFFFFVVSSAALVMVLNGPITSTSYSLPSPPFLQGSLAKNTILSRARLHLQDVIFGPESFAVHKTFRTTYSSLKSGHIVELRTNGLNSLEIQRVIHLRYGIVPNNCTGTYASAIRCGRPLGLRFRKKQEDVLLIADAYYGLYEFNVVTADVKIILKPGTAITNNPEAPPLRFLNDVDEMNDGETVILSEPSTKFSDRDHLYAITEHGGDGRLLSYNTVNGELKVLLDGLQYPNGVQLNRDGKCVLIAEMSNLRILRYCFNVPFSYSVFIDNLPGYPDNIRLSGDGNLWVPLGSVRLEDDGWITRRPFLRDTIAKVTSISLFQWIIKSFSPKYGLILLVDIQSGKILLSLHDPSGTHIPSVSQVEELEDGTLLIGGDENAFIGMLSARYWKNLTSAVK